MSKINSTARIEDGAEIADDVSIGPFCIVGANVKLGAGCRLNSHVSITGHTTIGAGTTVYPFASLGTAPQSLGYKGEPTRLEIGQGCIIRESVTINTGTVGGGGITRVGDRGFFMAYSHVGHDCIVGNDVIFANSATLGGHCVIGDFVFIGGLSAVHQFVRIGSQVMIGGVSGVREDVIPYGLATGTHAHLDGLNIVGMRRRKFTRERLHAVRHFYNELFADRGTFADRLDALKAKPAADPAAAEILAFIDADAKRSLCMPRADVALKDIFTTAMMDMSATVSLGNVGLIAGGGGLPFAVADALIARGSKPFLLAIKGFCDPVRVAAYEHQWVAVGQLGRLVRLLRSADCRDVLFIGSLVRPAISEIRLDLLTLRQIPRIVAAFRGGDDHLLKSIGAVFEQYGFRMLGVPDVAPEIMMPVGNLARAEPDSEALADIAKGHAALHALSPFDVGQACVVIDGNIVALEDIAGTDALLARVATLRSQGRLRAKRARGVLVKAPKTGQDLRFDLPTLGPRTVDGAIAAELAGIAIVAGRTLMAEPQNMIASADRAGLFITGLNP